MSPNAQALIEKIADLSPERLAEVEDFVDFIRSREHDQKSLAHAAAKASVPSFAAVWNNPEDGVYDGLPSGLQYIWSFSMLPAWNPRSFFCDQTSYGDK